MTNKLAFKNLVLHTEKASDLLTAMANEKRLQILCALSDEELSVSRLADKVELSQSALSQHLAKLRALKLVSTRRDAQMIYYSVDSPMIEPVLDALNLVFTQHEAPGVVYKNK
ncbi:MAG: Putative DNA-binding protein [Candidatus Tokpelaia hoelldobleri]|uniref:DNA-binding protein n=1 Tax=Candidatus Tokpelaia hoelldobleri TaxID=1902579 RepID=A0A1U9JTI7_9HYPH|nr:MAG: Putative DNA-binding protein [Candidatus Tokpelaia hoelldoblerii]